MIALGCVPARYSISSEALVRKARSQGKLVICEYVLAEVRPALESGDAMRRLLEDWELCFVPSSAESALLAGRLFSLHLRRTGKAGTCRRRFSHWRPRHAPCRLSAGARSRLLARLLRKMARLRSQPFRFAIRRQARCAQWQRAVQRTKRWLAEEEQAPVPPA